MRRAQAACEQVGQLQLVQVQLLHESLHSGHEQVSWLHVGQVQFAHVHVAHTSSQSLHWQVEHSS